MSDITGPLSITLQSSPDESVNLVQEITCALSEQIFVASITGKSYSDWLSFLDRGLQTISVS